MTLALVAASSVLVGWFGNPLWFRIVDRVWVWRMRRRNRRSPAPPARLATVAEMYKQMYAPDSVTRAAERPAPSLRVIRKARYPIVEATGDEKWVPYPGPWNNPKPPDEAA